MAAVTGLPEAPSQGWVRAGSPLSLWVRERPLVLSSGVASSPWASPPAAEFSQVLVSASWETVQVTSRGRGACCPGLPCPPARQGRAARVIGSPLLSLAAPWLLLRPIGPGLGQRSQPSPPVTLALLLPGSHSRDWLADTLGPPWCQAWAGPGVTEAKQANPCLGSPSGLSAGQGSSSRDC